MVRVFRVLFLLAAWVFGAVAVAGLFNEDNSLIRYFLVAFISWLVWLALSNIDSSPDMPQVSIPLDRNLEPSSRWTVRQIPLSQNVNKPYSSS